MRIVAVIAFLVFGLIAVGLIALTPGQPPTVSREQYNLAANQAAQLQTSLDAERQDNAVLTAQRYEAERRADAVLAASGNDSGVVIVAVAGFVVIAGALLLVIGRGLNSGPSADMQLLLMRMRQNEAQMDRIMAYLARPQVREAREPQQLPAKR